MDVLGPNDFWLKVSGEIGLTLPDLAPEPEQEMEDEIEHPEEEQVWNSKYFKSPPFRLRRCQIEGTNYWKENRDGCLLEHATGSGKTLTGLMIASNMFESSDYVIIACPLKDIALQWEEEAKEYFNKNVRIDIIDSDHSESRIGGVSSSIGRGDFSKSILIYVNNSLATKEEWNDLIISDVTKSFSIIIDEAHKWTSDKKLDFLERNIISLKNEMLSLTAKLHKGLTGKPRVYKLLENSRKPHQYTLFEAIREGSDGSTNRVLKPYEYHIHLIKIDLTRNHDSIRKYIEDESIKKTIEVLSGKRNIPTIVYVKSVKDPLRGSRVVAGKIASENIPCMDYIGKDDAEGKKEKRTLFNNGDIEVLVAVRCLDEGVNMPRIQRLMLAHGSLDDERQWIQRRGRALRIDPDFPENPEIHDFLPVPIDLKPDDEINMDTLELIKKHYNKVEELASLSTTNIGLKEYKEIMSKVNQW